MQVGDLVNHGSAVVLHATKEHVLCFELDKREFITWAVDDAGKTYSGHYFPTIFTAVEDYKERAQITFS